MILVEIVRRILALFEPLITAAASARYDERLVATFTINITVQWHVSTCAEFAIL